MSAPTITSISPASGPTAGGTTGVIIHGTNLTNPSAVTFGGASAIITASTGTTVTVTTPAHAAGLARVIVITTAGATTQAVNFTYVAAAAPTITSFSPTSGPASGGNTVTINGTNFLDTTAVQFGLGVNAQSFAILSNTQLVAVAPTSSGSVHIIVTNGTGTATSTGFYIYSGATTPVVSSVSPASGPASGGNAVVITGSGFTNASAVTFGSTAATSFTVASNTVINAVVPPGPIANGAVNIIVTGPGGFNTTGAQYTYLVPTVTSLSPNSGSVLGGNTVVLTGTNLDGATSITFGGNAANFTILSPTTINAVAPPGTAGTASIVVNTISQTPTYTYNALPTVTAVNPAIGLTAGGDSVVIGTDLPDAATVSVKFGTTPATGVSVAGGNIFATTPAHVAGTFPINITTSGGTDSTLSFIFENQPVISSITPASGPTAEGTVVTITGANLSNPIAVNFGTTPATSVIAVSDNEVTAHAPAGVAETTTGVTVDTPIATTNGAAYHYIGLPVLDTLSPSSGSIAGGYQVTLLGSGFLTATGVSFGGNPAVFTVGGDTSISATAPSGTGDVSVTVTTAGGTSSPQTFTYT